VCSHYLQSRELGDYIYGFIKSSSETFRLPSQPEIPIIMVGPGTGVAPFRGFLAERAALIRHKDQLETPGNPLRLGPALLFFGCRHSKHDFIYQRELEGYASQQIVELMVAFSHEEGSQYRFVQDHIRAQRKRVMDLMDQGAHVYICGDGVTMAPDVKRTFLELYQERYQCDSIVAEQWLSRLEATGRYCLDVFGQKGT
jgi:cytochrome P450/NADPH-cytochrome P450 reductase